MTRRRRALVIWAYGGLCACCGEDRFDLLQIDHINGDGHMHRESWGPGYSGQVFYRWLVSTGFPPGFQVLCAPCNRRKGSGLECGCQGRDRRSVFDQYPDMVALMDGFTTVPPEGRRRALARAYEHDRRLWGRPEAQDAWAGY